MDYATMVFHRQVIRLCKGVLKAWEQWVDDMTNNESPPTFENGQNQRMVSKEKENEISMKL